ncbi:unnamed protein product, partial [Prorocentrum cordatum]
SVTTLGSARARRGSSGTRLWRCSPRCGRRNWSPTFYSAGISACEKSEQWQRALALLDDMWKAKVQPNAFSYSAGISACEKGAQWQRAVALLSEAWQVKLEANSATALGSARAKNVGSGSGPWNCSARRGRSSWSSTT